MGRGEKVVVVCHSYGSLPACEAVRGLGVGVGVEKGGGMGKEEEEGEGKGKGGGVVKIVFLAAYVPHEGYCMLRGEREEEWGLPEFITVAEDVS